MFFSVPLCGIHTNLTNWLVKSLTFKFKIVGHLFCISLLYAGEILVVVTLNYVCSVCVHIEWDGCCANVYLFQISQSKHGVLTPVITANVGMAVWFLVPRYKMN